MALDQDIQLINAKDKNVSPEERHKWMPELLPVPKGNNKDIPVSVKELVYGRKVEGVGTFDKSLDRNNELIYLSEEFHGMRKERGPSEGLDTHVFQRKNPKYQSLVKNKSFCQRTRRRSWPKERTTAPWKLPKQEYSLECAKKGKASPTEQSEEQEKGKGKGKVQVEQALPIELHS
ncbi:hypothetical protein O181_026060 [Austropuccinia psidii MF-1]|uniref:Uncharacterized protein n=1 Tax=Austropuccinia psidii MF-1 TaxID=1389203 RepID=A0A9Q3CNR5_9BASI|nr:hypothetical protein [Austropuccinia psidii MF-1]